MSVSTIRGGADFELERGDLFSVVLLNFEDPLILYLIGIGAQLLDGVPHVPETLSVRFNCCGKVKKLGFQRALPTRLTDDPSRLFLSK